MKTQAIFIADFHIHSRYSRATSSELIPENLWKWAQYKGIQVLGTGDCIHPQWLKELEEKIEPSCEGFFQLKKDIQTVVEKDVFDVCKKDVRFVLSTEISTIYQQGGKTRKVHHVIVFSCLSAVKKFQYRLGKIGNISSDGRPILGLSSKDLLAMALECDERVLFIPAHIWTPWFSVLGSKSGFDTIQECYQDLTKYIYALETGLSSDPLMNWRLESLDDFIFVSNSDAHSLSKLGREANVFQTSFSYEGIYRALSDKTNLGLVSTIEFFPEEGKYHYDGHLDCRVCLHPRETMGYRGLCPVCAKPLTIGVLSRVEQLASRKEGVQSKRARPFKSIIPLEELIAQTLNVGKASKKVSVEYFRLIQALGCEFDILLNLPYQTLVEKGDEKIAKAILMMREGKVHLQPGYDGQFGIVSVKK